MLSASQWSCPKKSAVIPPITSLVTPWSLVCFRARAGDDATAEIMSRVNDGGRAFITHTRVDGRLVLRVSVGAPTVAERHVDALWDLIRGAR